MTRSLLSRERTHSARSTSRSSLFGGCLSDLIESWAQAQRGMKVNWIGTEIEIDSADVVSVTLPARVRYQAAGEHRHRDGDQGLDGQR